MNEQLYTPEFLAVHARHAANMPAHIFYNTIGKNLKQFDNPSDVFLPVSLDISLTNKQDVNAVRIEVAPSDQDWYGKLTTAIKDMMGIKTPIKIVTYTGKDIEALSHQQLINVGELMVVNAASGKQLVGDRLVPPPRSMAVDKLRDVDAWFTDKVRDGVVSLVANQLKDLEAAQLPAALVRDGKIQQSIGAFIKNSVPAKDWKQFLDTYARDGTAKTANLADGGDGAAAAIARGYLQQIRAAARANEPHITSFFAQKEALALTGLELDDQPLFSKPASAAQTSKFSQAGVMWREIVEDAMYHKATARIPIETIYNGHTRAPAALASIKMPVASTLRSNQTHPFKRANIEASIAERGYPGDSDRALSMYHLFSGRHLPEPPRARVNNRLSALPALVPIEGRDLSAEKARCLTHPGLCERKPEEKKKKKWYQKTAEEISSEMPKLVPISSLVSEDVAPKMPKLVPISAPVTGSAMPKLVPISSLVSEDVAPKMPKLVPISAPVASSAMPKLVPISSLVSEDVAPKMPKLVPISAPVASSATEQVRAMPKLVPISAPVASSATEQVRAMPKLVPIDSLIGCGHKDDKKKKKHVESEISYKDALLGAKSRSTKGRKAFPVQAALLEQPLFASGFDDAPNLDDFL